MQTLKLPPISDDTAALQPSPVKTPATPVDAPPRKHTDVTSLDIDKRMSATHKWHAVVAAAQENERLSALRAAQEKVKVVDVFATRMVESTALGGAISLMVWVATIAYVVFLIIQWQSTPPNTVNRTEWSLGYGPFPMLMTCLAQSGCLVSNSLTASHTSGISASVPPSQAACFRIPYKATYLWNVTYSVHPLEGISVLYDPASCDASLPPGHFGTVRSEMRCEPFMGCDVMLMETPLGPGMSNLQYVYTVNSTAPRSAQIRHEWFVQPESANEGALLAGTTPCWDGVSSVATLGNQSLAGWWQARLRPSSFWIRITVDQDAFWLFLWGTVGGSYALFLQLGFLMLMTVHMFFLLRNKVSPVTVDARLSA